MLQEFDDEAFDKINQPINETNIQGELGNVAAFIAYYGQMEQRWIEAHDNLKYQLERAAAKAGREHRDTAAKSSEGTVKEAVILDEQHDKLSRALLKAKAQKGKFTSAVNALESRLKALQSMNSNKKVEMGNLYSGGVVGGMASPAVMPKSYEYSSTPLSDIAEMEKAKYKMDDVRKAEVLKMLEEATRRTSDGLTRVSRV